LLLSDKEVIDSMPSNASDLLMISISDAAMFPPWFP
jgi:hypothetical protein